jgi:hypothetical protein
MMNVHCIMCKHVAKDEKALAEHISNQHGLSLAKLLLVLVIYKVRYVTVTNH